jgi:hypothetical protein
VFLRERRYDHIVVCARPRYSSARARLFKLSLGPLPRLTRAHEPDSTVRT